MMSCVKLSQLTGRSQVQRSCLMVSVHVGLGSFALVHLKKPQKPSRK
uniref:Uncharacterized protein n=1 Tax=Ciona savignyi TaxID=51511 RepID=H2YLV2_CIOSA